MCFIQQRKQPFKTFGDVSNNILHRKTHNNARRIFFIIDHCIDDAIKSCKREKTAEATTIRITPQQRNREVPKRFKEILAIGEIKINLVKFIFRYWST